MNRVTPGQAAPMIAVRNLFYGYEDSVEVLRNINLDIQRNELFVLFGPSRAGKTTLMRLFNRLSDLSDGATQCVRRRHQCL